MRISWTERWLAVALALGIRGVNGKPALSFDDAGFQGGREGEPNPPAIFILAELSRNAVMQVGPIPKSFGWKTEGQLQVDEVRLYTNSTTLNELIGIANDDGESGNRGDPNGVNFSTKPTKASSTSPTTASASQSIEVKPRGIESPHNRQNDPRPENGIIKLTRMFDRTLFLPVPKTT